MPALLIALLVPFCALIVFSDISARRVPNSLLAITLLLGAVLLCTQWALGQTGAPWEAPVGLVIGLIVLLPFYAIRWMGAGDVKLFATFGFLLGAKALLPIWVIASLLAGAHAIYVVLSNYRIRHVSQGLPDAGITQALVSEKTRRGTPYAAFLSVGALVTLFHPSLAHW
jgi:prepilin peptidase CpaA